MAEVYVKERAISGARNPQRGTFSEEDDLEIVESDAGRSIQIGLSNHNWLTEINRQVMPMESQSICSYSGVPFKPGI